MSIIYTPCNDNAVWQNVKNRLKSGIASEDLTVFSYCNYGEDMENVLSILTGLSGLVYEVIGNWISGETREHKDTLK